MFTTETSIRVRYGDTDQMGVVYHANYFYYFETGRAEMIRSIGFTYRQIEEAGIIMPVIEVNAKYYRPALYDDLLTIKTTLKELPEAAHRIEFYSQVFNEQNVLLVEGLVSLYIMDKATMKKSQMPALFTEKIKGYFSND